MGRTRTAVGRTNAPSRSESRAGGVGEEPERATPQPRLVLSDLNRTLPQQRDSPASKRTSASAMKFTGYDTPKSTSWIGEAVPPTPDFVEPERVVESNMIALKKCRHKLNVHMGGAKKFFLDWNTRRCGNLSREEMFKGFRDLHLDFTPAQADFLVRAFDSDVSNSVEYHEFCQTMEMSDADILKTVGTMSIINPPPWIKPKGWRFNPHEVRTIKKTQELIQQRMHQTFGGNPRDIRDAFLYMDKARSGFLSKDDFLNAFARIGVDVKKQELDLLLGYLDNEDQSHKIPYTNFVKSFESQAAGKFNPFMPTEKVLGTEKVTQEQLDSTGAPISLQQKWSDSYGRDPRYRVSFPEVYHAKLRPISCPNDFSDNPDFDHVHEWHQCGKTIGREINTLKPNKPIPPQESAQYKMRASRLGFTLPSVTAETGTAAGRCEGNLPARSSFGTKTKDDLVNEWETRFRHRKSTIEASRRLARATNSLPVSA